MSFQKKVLVFALVLTITLLLVISPYAAMPVRALTTGSASLQDLSSQDPETIFIKYLLNRRLVAGYPDGTFRPKASLTRAEAVTLLLGIVEPVFEKSGTGFKDVKPGHWAYRNIMAANGAGILKGYPDGTFRPNAFLTRSEAMALLVKVSNDDKNKIELPDLADVNNKHWAAHSVAVGLASGMVVMDAVSDRFYPDEPINRGEMARALAVLLTEDPVYAQVPLDIKLHSLKGTVQVVRSGSNLLESIAAGTALKPGDTILTASNGRVQIILPDGSGMLLRENTELVIREGRGNHTSSLKGKTGSAWTGSTFILKEDICSGL